MKSNSWYLEKLQIDARQRHAGKPIPIKIKKVKPKKRKRMKQKVKVKTKPNWEYPVEKLRDFKPAPEVKETFEEKQARIKATAERVNKSIGMDQYLNW